MSIFISYRRNTGSIWVNNIVEFFKDNGIDHWWDRDGLNESTGKFSDILRREIENSSDFLCILSTNALDNVDESSVFVQEIKYAKALGKTVIPVICGGFTYPSVLPESIDDLPELESVEVSNAKNWKNLLFVDILSKLTPTEPIRKALKTLMVHTPLEKRALVEDRLSIKDRLSGNIECIKFACFACQGFLSHARGDLEELMERNEDCIIQVVINDPECPAAKEAAEMKISSGSLRHRRKIIPQSYDDMLDWKEIYGDRFLCRTTDWYLPCAIFEVKRKGDETSTIKVDYYSFECADRDRRCVYITSDDEDNFSFYENQFDVIWNNAKEAELDEEGMD